jgi:RNA polymerase sigma-70 factor (ECF subfamily)
MSTATTVRADLDSPRWSDQTDEQLLLRYRSAGDPAAFEALVHRYERELYSYLQRYLCDAALAEDAFQATFLQVHLKREQFEEGRKVRPWLYTIATNQAIDAQRRNKRHRMVSLDSRSVGAGDDAAGALADLVASGESAPALNLEQAERRDWIRQAVGELPETLRRTVTLIYYQGLKYRDAAEVLGVPTGTVKSRMHAAVQRLTEAWNETHSLEHD